MTGDYKNPLYLTPGKGDKNRTFVGRYSTANDNNAKKKNRDNTDNMIDDYFTLHPSIITCIAEIITTSGISTITLCCQCHLNRFYTCPTCASILSPMIYQLLVLIFFIKQSHLNISVFWAN